MTVEPNDLTELRRQAERSMRTALDDLSMPLGAGGWESCARDIIAAAPLLLDEVEQLRASLGSVADDTRRYVSDRLADSRAEVEQLRAENEKMRAALGYIVSPTMGLPPGADAADFAMNGATELLARVALQCCILQARAALASVESSTRPTDPTIDAMQACLTELATTARAHMRGDHWDKDFGPREVLAIIGKHRPAAAVQPDEAPTEEADLGPWELCNCPDCNEPHRESRP